MTRDEVLALYDPVRGAIQRILRLAETSCGPADFRRALRQVAPWAPAEALREHRQALDMATDIALFEPNQRGNRAYDRFLAGPPRGLPPEELDLARRMAGARVSLFRVAGRDAAAGLRIEDLLDGGRAIWWVDRSAEDRLAAGEVIGMRLFDAGPFHAAFGIVLRPETDTVEDCVAAAAAGGKLPVRHGLAARLYGDWLMQLVPPGPADLATLSALLERMAEAAAPPPPAPRGRRRRG